MTGRVFCKEKYRYGFNSQGRSTEIHNNSFSAEFWEYDSRLGRRWNIDPIVKDNESPYAVFSNNPIWFKDSYGADTASGTINVAVVSKTRDPHLKVSYDDLKKAADNSKGNLVLLEVSSLKDLLTQMKTVTKNGAIKIENLIIDSHGDYDKAQFKIGGTVVKEGTGTDLQKLGTYMSNNGNVVLLACHAGGNTINGGETMIMNLSCTMKSTVYGCRSWTGYPGLGKNINPSQMNPDRLNDDQSPKAWDFIGQWNVSTNGVYPTTLSAGITLGSTGKVSKNWISPAAPLQKGAKKISNAAKAIKKWWNDL